MGKVKTEVQELINTCDKLYQVSGSSAVIQYINEAKRQGDTPIIKDVSFERCDPCESYMPSIGGQCLVCGQPVQCPSIGDKLNTVGELRSIIQELDDHDQICIETIDLDTGDVHDLYPMYMDVIEGIELTDGTNVREVRFCQMPNSEPDTRDKQPVVDALIDVLAEDIAKGDVTVLDELLLRMPYDVLKYALPEDMWEDFNNKS